jgi:hypothetical protein
MKIINVEEDFDDQKLVVGFYKHGNKSYERLCDLSRSKKDVEVVEVQLGNSVGLDELQQLVEGTPPHIVNKDWDAATIVSKLAKMLLSRSSTKAVCPNCGNTAIHEIYDLFVRRVLSWDVNGEPSEYEGFSERAEKPLVMDRFICLECNETFDNPEFVVYN